MNVFINLLSTTLGMNNDAANDDDDDDDDDDMQAAPGARVNMMDDADQTSEPTSGGSADVTPTSATADPQFLYHHASGHVDAPGYGS